MTTETSILCLTAISIGFLHTLMGPDHYLPFIVMAKARRWTLAKTAWVTLACGVGHIASSVVLGLVGVALGLAVVKLEAVESSRAPIAAWGLIGFGIAYAAWGLRRAWKSKAHKHTHLHKGEKKHSHDHIHQHNHAHVHPTKGKANITPWALFVIFVLGPCEPLIPILMYPAAKSSVSGLLLVTAAFGATTIFTMLGLVLAASWGLNILPLGKMERYAHALAGGAIAMSGMAIQFLGL